VNAGASSGSGVYGSVQDMTGMPVCAGQRKLVIPSEACQEIVHAFSHATELLHLFSQPGWFLHLAFMEDVKGRFDSVHARIARTLQVRQLISPLPACPPAYDCGIGWILRVGCISEQAPGRSAAACLLRSHTT
jgi:hypothetical protein